jgi:translation initiation factor 1 (eIF-1/SUI1)
MTKIPVRVSKKRKPKVVENIHSINNQEFRFDSLIQRLKKLWTNLF